MYDGPYYGEGIYRWQMGHREQPMGAMDPRVTTYGHPRGRPAPGEDPRGWNVGRDDFSAYGLVWRGEPRGYQMYREPSRGGMMFDGPARERFMM